MMRIAMISEHASPLAPIGSVDSGGQNVHVARLSATMASMGHHVRVYTRRDSPDQPLRTMSPEGYEVVNVPAGPARRVPKDELLPYMPAFSDWLANEWREDPPEIAHSHFWMSGWASLRAVARSQPGRIRTAHTYHALGIVKRRHQRDRDTSPIERFAVEPWIGSRADAVIATCSDEAFELRGIRVPKASISVIPCGVDTDTFHPNGPDAFQDGRPRVGVIGRLVPRKGVDIAIKAVALAQAAGHPDLELTVVGGGGVQDIERDPEVRRLRGIAAEHHADHVRFVGQVPPHQMPSLLRSLSAVVCTPWYEPFGIVPLEAMATARPVIAAAVGGFVDTVTDERTGLLVPPRNPDATAAAIDRLLSDPGLATSFGERGRQRALQRYTWKRIASSTLSVYRRLSTGRRTGRSAQPQETTQSERLAARGGGR